jgi:hypothetical protein
MQELIDAAVASAGKNGLRLVILAAEKNGAPTGAPATGGDVAAAVAEMNKARSAAAGFQAERDAASAKVAELTERLGASEKALAEAKAAATAGISGDSKAFLDKIAAERDALAKELTETKAKLAAAPAAGIPLGAPQPAPLAALRDYKIEVLGLDAEVAKKCAKANIATIGQLEDIAIDPAKMKEVLKLTKDQVTEVHSALLRRARASEGPVGAAPAGANGAQASALPVGAPDVPHGHKDQLWMERYNALRKQERTAVERRQKVDVARAALTARWPSARQLNPEGDEVTVMPTNLPPGDFAAFFDMTMKLEAEDKILGVIQAKETALRYALGLEHRRAQAPTIDDALRLSGLVHLIETPPATGGAPAAAPAAAPAPAGAPK